MHEVIDDFRRNEDGAALIEYSMLVGLIAVICIGAVTVLGQEISTALQDYAAALTGI